MNTFEQSNIQPSDSSSLRKKKGKDSKSERPISLVSAKHEFGERIVFNEEIEKKYGKLEGMLKEKTGKEKGHEWRDGIDSAISASLRCLESLLREAGVDMSKVKAVFGTANPIYIERKLICESLTRRFTEQAGFSDDVKIFEESFGCGGAALGVRSMYDWFQDQPAGTYAVYVTQDCPREMVEDWNTEALFSDAVSVSLWTNGSDGIAEIVDVFASDSNIDDTTLGIDEEGVWRMHGKGVVEDASDVPAMVARQLGIDLRDYTIAPHQPNAKLLETLEEMYKVDFYKNVAKEHGNPTCSGAFIALEKVLAKEGKDNSPMKDILVMPFGAGGYGGFILRRKHSRGG